MPSRKTMMRAIRSRIKSSRSRQGHPITGIFEPSVPDITDRDVLRLADAAEESGNYPLAIMYHTKVAELWGEQPSFWKKIAGLQKAMGRVDAAQASLVNALRLEPGHARTHIELGDLYLVQQRYDDAEAAFRAAALYEPDGSEPAERLRDLVDLLAAKKARDAADEEELIARDEQLDRLALVGGDTANGVNPALFPSTRVEMLRDHQPEFVTTFIGIDQRTIWGHGPVVRGIGSLRGHILSVEPFRFIEIYVDGQLTYTGPLNPGPLVSEQSSIGLQKYSYNAWIDFGRFSLGWHDVIFRAIGLGGQVVEGVNWVKRSIIVDKPLPDGFFAEAMCRVPRLDPSSSGSLIEQVRTLPSAVAEASPNSYPGPIRNVAVLRLDGLGDVAVSVPFFLRLRKMLPNAKIVALASADNADGCLALGLFDEVIAIDFPESPYKEGRYLSAKAQVALMDQLASYRFDLAITGMVSQGPRELAVMTGAPVTIGFGGDDPKTLSIHYDTRDPKSGANILNYAARYGMLASALEVWLDSGARVQKRENLTRDLLTRYGIGADDRYVVLHTGSRIAATEWPGYAALASRITSQLQMKVVYIASDASQGALLPESALADGSIVLLTGLVPFDDFDALLSFCSAFVGNDSGPGHLAALRGAKAIRILSARIGATEWKSEIGGVCLYRRMPCAGCGAIPIYRQDECTYDIACVKDISVDEVYEQVTRLVDEKHDLADAASLTQSIIGNAA